MYIILVGRRFLLFLRRLRSLPLLFLRLRFGSRLFVDVHGITITVGLGFSLGLGLWFRLGFVPVDIHSVVGFLLLLLRLGRLLLYVLVIILCITPICLCLLLFGSAVCVLDFLLRLFLLEVSISAGIRGSCCPTLRRVTLCRRTRIRGRSFERFLYGG